MSLIRGAGRWRRPRFLLQSLVAFLLLLAIVVYVARLTAPMSRLSVDLGGRSVDVVPERLRRLLEESAPHHLAFTYFVSHRDHMPSRFKGVEERVRRVLDAVRRVAPQRIDIRVIDPAISGAAAIGYAASRKVSPVSVKRIHLDEHSEQKIWSSLVVSFEGAPEFLIADIQTADVSFLSGLLLARLEALHQPITPVFAISTPAGRFEQFPRYLSQHGPVVEVDLGRSPLNLPNDVDILFWLEPTKVTRGHIRALQRFVDSGRSIVLAGSSYDVTYAPGVVDSLLRYRIRPSGDHSWSFLLRHFGLQPVADLVLDSNTGPITVTLEDHSRRRVKAPFHLRNLPAFRDFRKFRTPARGGVSFVAASPLQIDPQRAASAGFEAHIVATTTERVRVSPLPEQGTFSDADLSAALNVPKQNLMVLLSPPSAWSGQILALASASMFRDGVIDEPGYGHTIFIADLVRTFAAPDRLVRARVDRGEPPPLPAVSTTARILWRGIIIFLVPAILVGLGLHRLLESVRSGTRREKALRGAWWKGRVALVALLVLGVSSGLPGLVSHLDLDLTENGTNSLADETIQLLGAQSQLSADLIVSPKSAMPRALKGLQDRLTSILEGAGIEVEVVHPENLSASQRQQLQAEGLVAFEVEGVKRDTVSTYQIWSALRLRRSGNVAVIPRLDEQTVGHLDFLLVAALTRLDEGRGPLLSVVSDLPRLSPAEALEDFQKKGLSAPQGVDVYGSLKRLLTQYGYRVQHVNPRYPQLEPEADAVLWLQPRRDSGEIILQLGDYLAAGGNAVVAMQHFNIQQRQYRGIGFGTVYWPQPQFQDFDRYLRLVGVEQVREVLMDRTRHHLQLDTQVNRTAVREYDPQQVALPFLIRAVGAHFSTTSAMTRRLGDLSFIWGNRFSFDRQALTAAGFATDVLVETSDRTWSFPWSGGFLPPEIFTSTDYLDGRQPLALRLRGPFPPVEFVERDERTVLARRLRGDTPHGSLTLIGCSEMFKNDRLAAAGFDHQQFILNAVAAAALDPQVAALQSRRGKVRGFAFVEPSSKLWWRLTVTSAAPMALMLFGLLRWRRWTRISPVSGR